MKKSEFRVILKLPEQNGEKRDAFDDNSPSGLARKIAELIEEQVQQKSPIRQTAAFKVFADERLVEFVKNAIDAKATNMTITCYVDYKLGQLFIAIKDDGKKAIPKKLVGPYDWKRALLTKSLKAGDKTALGGKQLGLAMSAHFLEMHGKGSLSLAIRSLDQGGATIYLRSSMVACTETMMTDRDISYVRTMILDLERYLKALNPEELIAYLSTVDCQDQSVDDIIGKMLRALTDKDSTEDQFGHPAAKLSDTTAIPLLLADPPRFRLKRNSAPPVVSVDLTSPESCRDEPKTTHHEPRTTTAYKTTFFNSADSTTTEQASACQRTPSPSMPYSSTS